MVLPYRPAMPLTLDVLGHGLVCGAFKMDRDWVLNI